MKPPKHCRFCRHFEQFDEAEKARLRAEKSWFIALFDGLCGKSKGPEYFGETCNLWEQEQ